MVLDAVFSPDGRFIASGGVGTLEHFYEGLTIGGADAALAASIFHFGEFRVSDVKDYLQSKGVVVRPLSRPSGVFDTLIRDSHL